MELTNTNDENSFDPTPKLKSNPIPINFISFNNNDTKCFNCGEYYVLTHYCYQRYCKKCLSNYLTNITDNNIYLDVYIFTRNLKCSEHEIIRTKEPQNIQGCCKNCLEILWFKQIPTNHFSISGFGFSSIFERNLYDILKVNVVESEKYCKLCGKSLYQGTDSSIKHKVRLCSYCYLITYGNIESTFTKKLIPIIYLPWWHNKPHCDGCGKELKITSDCQKYCGGCFIFYIGCRYCLTTNIIFGLTTRSQCRKCQRVSYIIDNLNILSGNSELDDFLANILPESYNNFKADEFADKIKSSEYYIPLEINSTIRSLCQNYKNAQSEKLIEWISYPQFTDVKEIARGGFGIIYRGTLDRQSVILKKFKNSQDTSRYFLNELKSNQYCYEIKHHIIRTHGVTKDPKLGEYMLVMQYASGGDLHNWLQKSFVNIKWNKDKLIILWQISEGLETIHKADYIHRDFHSGNILYDLFHNNSIKEKFKFKERHQWLIGDLGLSQPANSTSSNNEIYGVIPYIAPEIFKGSSFSKESDIYSIGMIMWELTTGCKPFANVEHDHKLIFKILDGERPEITEDTPECYADLMKSCWDPDPKKRPLAKNIRNTFGSWSFRKKHNDIFDKAELKRIELLNLKKLGPEFAKKPHSKAIYTSRPLSYFISKCSSINSSLFDSNEQAYISKELEFDIESAERYSNCN
ncbi:Sps1p [Rhizophagus irregularis DAOM 197198w]|uniref:Sps1p n=1 Tax=Rhizophagus irregularis (strain DAOM 197198w) TaxID=1432141 RepID=A0A015JMX3_RHIIW|nr:Sps1p [Rhizophagus irregularis DAOM 197198w]